jgi:hypothetical protein
VNHESVGYVQDHKKQAQQLHSCRNSTDGCDDQLEAKRKSDENEGRLQDQFRAEAA